MSKIKKFDEFSLNEEIKQDDNLIEYTIPEWSLPALINGDYSGLEDDDEIKLKEFINRVADEFGNAHFMMGNDFEGEDNLGFKHRNDIDNLGSNCYRLYIRQE